MWNDRKAVTLSIVCTKIAVVLVIAFAVFVSLFFVVQYTALRSNLMARAFVYPIHIACCVPSLIALAYLHRMLLDIRTGAVFTVANVRRFRIISWCSLSICVLFLVEIILLPRSPHYLLCAVAGFFSLLMCIFKNAFDVARRIKDENDYTI